MVRAKRGTAQSSRDKQGNAPKSAGASIRRYNESALSQVSLLEITADFVDVSFIENGSNA